MVVYVTMKLHNGGLRYNENTFKGFCFLQLVSLFNLSLFQEKWSKLKLETLSLRQWFRFIKNSDRIFMPSRMPAHWTLQLFQNSQISMLYKKCLFLRHERSESTV